MLVTYYVGSPVFFGHCLVINREMICHNGDIVVFETATMFLLRDVTKQSFSLLLSNKNSHDAF